MMTTEGAISLRDLMKMSDAERLRWLNRCIERNEEMEDKFGGNDRPSGDRY